MGRDVDRAGAPGIEEKRAALQKEFQAGNAKDADTIARFKQYDYKQNSNLVLTANRSARIASEPTGAPESLKNKRMFPMGDRVAPEKPVAKTQAKRRPGADELDPLARKQKRARAARSVLDVDAAGLYRPRTRETRAAYEAMLSKIQESLGDQPEDILRGAADEVLSVIKAEGRTAPQKKKELEGLLGSMTEERFGELHAISDLIGDFTTQEEREKDAAGVDHDAEEFGVAVEFDEEEEEQGDPDDVMAEEVDGRDEDEEGGEEDELGKGDIRTRRDLGADGDGDAGLNPQDIDAYWLQREVARAYGEGALDPNQAMSLADEVLGLLGSDAPDLEVESQLVALVDYDRFPLIKMLLGNRDKVVWCTRLARAQSDAERAEVEAAMPAPILEALRATRGTKRERQAAAERAIKSEARKLRERMGAGRDGAGEGAGAGDAAAGRRQLDLENLEFHEGGRLMSNKKVELPGSYRMSRKGYEEVHVPALKPKPMADKERLVNISDMPEWAWDAFSGMKQLNRIQSRVYDTALFSSENLLICAPTGAGKTNVAMLSIMHTVGLYRREDGTIDTSAFKIVYVAPMKALVAEMVGNFGKRLEAYGIKVRELTGDVNLSRAEIEDTQVIVTTPEKWDIITRKSGDRTYTNLVKLLIIDEIHLLHDDRGPVLEAIVARTVRQIESTQEMIRLVGLSATLPNYEDVAAFLRVDPEKGLFFFDNSFRPCPLEQQFIGITVRKPLQRFQLMNEICYEKVAERAGKHQILVFVHSRKETAKTAKYLRDQCLAKDIMGRFMRDDAASREILQSESEDVKSSDLKDLLPHGFAIHHAGMQRSDRQLVEDLFADRHIQVLVSTATLAWGVNLPAHTVIIKGTEVYNPVKSGWDQLSMLDMMQMLGRAGRPQHDTFGEGIVLTGHGELQFYLSLLNQQLPVESQLVGKLADSLNAEVVLGTVSNLKEAAQWLGYTYLYVRMLRNPTLYGLPVDEADSDPLLESRRADLAHTAASVLDKNNLLRYDRRSGSIQTTDLGRIASHYYVTHSTIATYNEHLRPSMGEIDLLRLFALSDEFKYILVRDEEKQELAKLVERVPIPVKESIEEPTAKINMLLQTYISRLKLEGLAVTSDMVYVTQSAGRLVRCLFEICLRRGWAQLADKALSLCKMVTRRIWASQSPLRQFRGVPPEILQKIERKDIAWERYYDLTPAELGELVRMPKLGKSLHRLVHQFPKLELSAHVQPITRSVVRIELTITPDFAWDDKVHGFVEPFWVLVEDADSEVLLHHELFLLRAQYASEDHTLAFTVPIAEPLPPQYFVRVVSDRWLQSETTLPVSFQRLLLPAKFPPPTELLDLQPLPISALRNAEFEAIYEGRVRTFNPIQMQVFAALYNTDDNVLVAAPTGSGKTACAEFAVLRMLSRALEGKCPARCVYVAPTEAIVRERLRDWEARFGKVLGLAVRSLTGAPAADNKILESSNLCLATAEQWDMLSRRWRQRRAVQDVALLVADELHLLSGEGGHVMEVAVSRTRFLSSLQQRPIRIVGLASSVANARDMGEWIGAPASCLFNFPPGVRPVPLEIHVQGFDVSNFEARMQAMAKPAFNAIVNHAQGSKPALVFVPTRKHARLTALDLLTFAASNGEPGRFLHVPAESLAPYLEKVKDKALRHALQFGVAFVHESMPAVEREVVDTLFESGAIQVVVATAATCWGMTTAAFLVVIMGTQFFDGSGIGGSDMPVADLLQMIGRASRPLVDDMGKCVLMCHGPKKEYYKKFLFEPLPVESHLDHFLHDHLNAEVTTREIETKQDAVDWLTWTFFFRRLTQNPNYYNLTGVTQTHLSEHLSELVESTLTNLEQARCIAVEEDTTDVSPLNLGMIAAYYYLRYTTIELFGSSLTAKTKTRGLLEIVCAASEFDSLPTRPGDDDHVRRLVLHSPVPVSSQRYTDPHVKANALLQAHFSRKHVGGDMAIDQQKVVRQSLRLLHAAVDVIASSGWLAPAVAAMEMSQMVTQGMWDKDSPLLQLPHFTRDKARECKEAGVETVFDLLDLEDAKRDALLGMSETEMADVARVCNRYPDVQLAFQLSAPRVAEGEAVQVAVELEREWEGDVPPVDAPLFPGRRDEGWWLVVGDPASNQLLAIKKVTLGLKNRTNLQFKAPGPGQYNLKLMFMCDAYLGCDQEYDFALTVTGDEADGDGQAEEKADADGDAQMD